MNIFYNTHLWLNSCAGDYITILAGLMIFYGVIMLSYYFIRRHYPSGSIAHGVSTYLMYGTSVMYAVIIAYGLFGFIPPDIVRLAVDDGQLNVTSCNHFSEQNERYSVKDIMFQYVQEKHPDGIAHHMLVIQKRGIANPLGKVELLPQAASFRSYNFETLEQIAPTALREYRQASEKAAH